jgi:menaquinone-9 beta-reductase
MAEPGSKPDATVSRPTQKCDVTIIGGGLGGKAAAIHLATAGFKVVCIEPEASVRQSVGESLDWSAPDLLCALGLSMEKLVQSQIATWKRHVTVKMRDGCSAHYVPSEWLAGKPFHVELRTLHVDRLKLDQELLNLTLAQGVELVHDKVVSIEREGNRVRSVSTAAGQRYNATWFVDASGVGSSIFGREFQLPAVYSGPPKVVLWKYFPIADAVEGTTIYADPSPSDYLEWVWEIPIQTSVVSVGYVLTGAAMKAMRAEGLTVDEIFERQLMKFPRFEGLLATENSEKLNVTSFRCRAHLKTAGPNWVMVGEAASMVDPITSNGVTAALRHAAEAAAMIQEYGSRGALPWRAQALYSARVLLVAKFFNGGIEKIVYEPPVRNRVGLPLSGTIYTGPAWSMNAVYARMKPKGMLSTWLLGMILGAFRWAAWLLNQFCKMSPAATSSRSPA